MNDEAWEARVARMLLEAEDDFLSDAIASGDLAGVERTMGLSGPDAALAARALGPVSDAEYQAAVERGLARSRFLGQEPRRPAPGAPPSSRTRPGRWGFRTRCAWVVAPVVAAAVMGLVMVRKPRPELPRYWLRPLAVGESTTKTISKRAEGVLLWRRGMTFHVRLTPEVRASVRVSAQVFLRHQRGVLEIPVTVEDREDGLHVFAEIGRDAPLPRGRHEVVVVVTAADEAVEIQDVARWGIGTSREDGWPVFWFRVHVRKS